LGYTGSMTATSFAQGTTPFHLAEKLLTTGHGLFHGVFRAAETELVHGGTTIRINWLHDARCGMNCSVFP
jgi:hypothetical protein